jgi:tetratricopeptide (TPR) repeat protein
MKRVGTWITAISLFAATTSVAQSNRELAEVYFKKGDCEKALEYYNQALKSNFDRISLKNYTSCLIKSNKWSEAERYFKRQLKSDEQNATWYHFNWGIVLEAQGKQPEAETKYDDAIKSLGFRTEFYRDLSEEFRMVKKAAWSLKTLLRARELAKNVDVFRLEVASLYRDLNQTEKMISELLSYGMLFRNSESVQNMLQDFLKDENEQVLLEKVLYEKIQSAPNEPFYNELLIGYQIQRKDFYRAFIQERALDKRFKYGGSRVFNLGQLALQNKDYENAVEIFQYLVKEYPKTQLYPIARRLVIYAREEKVKTTFPINKNEVRQLLTEYQSLLDELGTNESTQEAMRDMAILNGFYLNDKAKAIEILTAAIEVGKRHKSFVDRCKLDLGDIYLLTEEPWEAALLYSQVEKSQKDDLLGYEAKLRNAKRYYFKGDFELAKELLDILKKATSREIANDANELSLLIMDNTGLDTSEQAMRSYAAVELLLFQNRTTEAIDSLRNLYTVYSEHSLADEILWLTAKTFVKLDSVQQAIPCLEIIRKKFDYDILADDALFELGRLNEEKLKNKENAMKIYEELLTKYPGSIFVTEARKRFRLLRGDTIN